MKLKDIDPNAAGADYINANYINWRSDESLGAPELGIDPSNKIYIATQGFNTVPCKTRLVFLKLCVSRLFAVDRSRFLADGLAGKLSSDRDDHQRNGTG